MLCPCARRARVGSRMVALLAFALAVDGTSLFAEATLDSFGVGKKLDYLQSSAAAPTSQIILGDPAGPFHFSADLLGANLNQLATPPKLTLPDGATQYTLTGTSASKGIAASYSSKTALDAAFPNGTYTFVAGGSNLPIALGTSDAYPAEIPQITSGTWDGQGKLLINATSGAALSFNSFSNYATGVGGTITFSIFAVSGSVIGSELLSADSVALAGYSSDAALTSYTIAAGALQADRTYYAELSFSRTVALNTSYLETLGAFGLASYVKTTGLMISTASAVVAPSITTQPASQTLTVGGGFTLTVAASGNPTPTFQWRKDGVAISGATFTTFSVNNAQLVDAGSYTVVASNGAGLTTSDVAVVTVNLPPVGPSITTQPSDQTVTAGQPASFSVVATGTAPFSYQWKKEGVAVAGATSATYPIAIAASGDAGTYTVVVTNSVSSVTSNGASLTVNVAPAITTQPISQSVTAGNSVTFSAAASGTPSPTYQWKKGGVPIGGATNSSYTIASTVEGDAGIYTVVATNSISSATSDAATLIVNAVSVAPSITTQPQSQTVATGASVTLTVAVSGTPAPTFQWQKNGIDIVGANSRDYYLSAVTDSANGNYRVIATNSVGSATSDVALIQVMGSSGMIVPNNAIVTFTIE